MRNTIKLVLVLFTIITMLLLQGCEDNVIFDINQVDEQQQIEVSVYGEIETFDVEVIYNHKVIYENTYDYNGETVIVDGVYGYNRVKVTTYNGKTINSTSKEIGLSASEYNIAALNATMPVTLFSVELNVISKDIPTFIMLERTSAYNWDNLPENVYKIPGFDEYNLIDHIPGEEMHPIIYDWISDLYEINSESFFNVYYNDMWLSAALQVLKGNNIQDENYHLTLLSDGTGTSINFNELYDVENPYEVYNELLVEYTEFINNIKIENDDSMYNNQNIKYLYTMVNENENVEYWATRIQRVYFSKDEKFQSEIDNHPRMIAKSLGTILDDMSEEDQTNLKGLFDFNESFFEEAELNNKKVMLILGTWDQYENNFEEYISFLQTYYGDEYVYYYKGHPFTPTHSIEGKEEYLNEVGLIDIDSTIPAELLLFFNPEIYCSGYSTTTFESIDADKMLCIFNEYTTSNDNFLNKIDVRIEIYDDGLFLLTFKDDTQGYFDYSKKEIIYI